MSDAQIVPIGGKYQLEQPEGRIFSGTPTLTLTDADSNIVFGPNQAVDEGSASGLPTWTLSDVPVGTYSASGAITIDGTARTFTDAVQVVAAIDADPANAYRFGPVSTDPACEVRAVVSSAGGQYLYCEIEASAKDGSGAADPTSFSVSVAFANAGEPDDSDWLDADWVTVSGKHYARALIAADMLDCGAWYAWAQVADGAPAPQGRGGIVAVM